MIINARRPTIRQLEYFVALGRTLHFGRAARLCAVSQPALSAQIRDLEEALGVALFERTRQRVLVTPVGAALLARARRALEEVDALVAASAPSSDPLVGTLCLGVIPTVAPYVLPRVLRSMRRDFPELRPILREARTEELVNALREGDLELLFLALPVASAGIRTLPLVREPFVLAAPKGHRLLQSSQVDRQELEGETVILLEDGHCLREQALDLCAAAGASEHATIQATSMSTLAQMVAGGMGVTLLPASAVALEVRAGFGIEVRPFAGAPPERTLGFAWRSSTPMQARYELLGEAFVQEMARVSGRRSFRA